MKHGLYWLALAVAILFEVGGTINLKLSQGFQKWIYAILALLFFLISLFLLTIALQKIASGVVTAVWAGGGMILMTLVGHWFLQEAISKKQVIALSLLTGGIILLTIDKLNAQSTMTKTSINTELQEVVNQLIHTFGDYPIYNAALLVDSPSRGISFQGASGYATGQEKMTSDHKFRIASISKTFTATIVLQLVEENRLHLHDRASELLPEANFLRWDSLSYFNGRNYGKQIEVVHLLKHRSGLEDYMLGDERFLEWVAEHPSMQWSPEEMMHKYFAYDLHRKAKGKPGQYHYSDTNYLILALIIEKVTGKTLAENYRERIFDPLEMNNSFLGFYEPERGPAPMSHPYQGTIFTETINTSFDWGGGGIVSTLSELNTFIRALVQGQLFQQKKTLNYLFDFEAETNSYFSMGTPTSDYGMGIRRLDDDNYQFVGHSGSWGCLMYYDAKKDLSICMTVNQGNSSDQVGAAFQNILSTIKTTYIYDKD